MSLIAETGHNYNNAPKHLVNGDVAYLTDTIKAILLSAYTFAATHDTLADVLAAGTESVGSGYVARGATLASKTVTAATNVTTLGCSSPVWTTTSGNSLAGAWIVYYKDSGVNTTSYLISAEDLGGTQTASNGGTFTQGTSSGILTLTA